MTESTTDVIESAETESLKVYYRFDDEGFYLGTTGTECENSTEAPLEYEPGYWYFWDKTENSWSKEKIPETVEDCASITIDYAPENTSNHTETLLAVVRRIFATYNGEQYSFNAVTNADTGHILYSVTKYSDEEILNNHKNKRLSELSTVAEKALNNAYVVSSLGFKADANTDAVRNLEGLVTIGSNDVAFCDYDNVIHEHITAEQIQILQKEILLNGQNLYAQKWGYRAAINNAESLETLNGIEFNFVMGDFLNNE